MTRQSKDPGTAQDARNSWGMLGVTLAIQAMVAMAALTLPAIAPIFAQRLGVTPALTGLYVALVYVGAMVASLMAGQAVRRYGAIRVSQAGLVLCAAGLALSAAPSLLAVGAGAILIGIGYGPITPASSHLLAANTPAERVGLMFSIKQTGVPLGVMLAGLVAPPLVLYIDVSGTLMAVAMACLGCALVSQPLRAVHDADRQPEAVLSGAGLLRPLRLVFSDPGLRRLAVTSFVFSGVQLCLAGYLVTYLHAELGYSLISAGIALSVAQTGGVAGRILWGYLADRYFGVNHALTLLALTMGLCAILTGLLAGDLPLAVVLAVVACFGVSATGWNGVYLAAVARLAPPGMAGTATGGALSVTFFGVVVMPVAFGGLSEAVGGFGVAYLLLALPLGICALLLLRARER